MSGSSSSGSAGRGKRGLFFRVRLGILLCLLAGVVVYALRDIRQRASRNEWNRPIGVAVILLTRGQVDPAVARQLEERLPALQARLNREFQRFTAGGDAFQFTFLGPADVSRSPPAPPVAEWSDIVSYHFRQWRYTSAVDDALALDSADYDSRIYVIARPAKHERVQLVEGHSQQGGRVGIVQVELAQAMVDTALAVAAHELFHTLGATDKYDALGNSRIPDGLAEPDLRPRFPQRYVEIMSRKRPIAAGREVPLDHIQELRVGPLTAREIGWTHD